MRGGADVALFSKPCHLAQHHTRHGGEPSMWPDRRIQDLLGIELPIIQAPMAGPVFSEMVIAVAEAGGLGSLPCATLSVEQMRSDLGIIRQRTAKPINLNFFCHGPPVPDAAREATWRSALEPLLPRGGPRPRRPRAGVQPRAVRRHALRPGRGISARGRQLPFRPAGTPAARARQSGGREGSSPPPPRSTRRAGWRRMAATP